MLLRGLSGVPPRPAGVTKTPCAADRKRVSTFVARSLRFGILCAALVAGRSAPARATIYDVGPGQPLAAIGDAPWATLQPGDEVRIHWRPEPYREKWVIGRSGTAQAPIVVRGIPSPDGARPVVSGDGATTPAPLDYTNEQRGVIKIGTSNVPPSTLPSHLVIEGLEIRSAHPAYPFYDDHGLLQSYGKNAASIYVERAAHLVIRDCVLHDSGNGLFIGAFDGQTTEIRIEGNHLFGNGNDGSAFEHNSYTAALGIVYEANRFGRLRLGADGNNLKDRSAGLVVRYNWIEGGNRQLDLVDAEDSGVLVAHPSYRRTFVYGNVLIEPDGAGNSQIVHYGGDSGNPAIYRHGVLHFFHNTVVSLRTGNTTLVRLSTDDETADVRNNVLYVAAGGHRLALLNQDGELTLVHNWLKPGWVESHAGPAGVHDGGGNVEGAAPGFADETAQDFRPLAGSATIDAGAPLAAGALPLHAVTRRYAPHLASDIRRDPGAPDLGAFAAVPEPDTALAGAAALAALAGLAARRVRRRPPHRGIDLAHRPSARLDGREAAGARFRWSGVGLRARSLRGRAPDVRGSASGFSAAPCRRDGPVA